MTRSRAEIAKAKLRMLEIYSSDPKISDAEIGRVCGLDNHTVAKYRKELMALISNIKMQVEGTQKEVEQETVGIWQKVAKMLG